MTATMDNETNLRIGEIMARWQVSTPGEWITTADDPTSVYAGEIVAVCDQDDPEIDGLHHVLKVDDLDERPADLIFAANAHQDIPFLVSVIAEQNARIASQLKHIDDLNGAMMEGREYARQIDGQLRNKIAELEAEIAALKNGHVGFLERLDAMTFDAIERAMSKPTKRGES